MFNSMTAALRRSLIATATVAAIAGALFSVGAASAHSALPANGADTPRICDTIPHVQRGDLSGVWGNDGETVVLTHAGSSLNGLAFYNEGGSATYTGCFDGKTFYLAYTNAVDYGYATLTLTTTSGGSQVLSGTWYSTKSNSGTHPWTLERWY